MDAKQILKCSGNATLISTSQSVNSVVVPIYRFEIVYMSEQNSGWNYLQYTTCTYRHFPDIGNTVFCFISSEGIQFYVSVCAELRANH
jgi:hypothetical protein